MFGWKQKYEEQAALGELARATLSMMTDTVKAQTKVLLDQKATIEKLRAELARAAPQDRVVPAPLPSTTWNEPCRSPWRLWHGGDRPETYDTRVEIETRDGNRVTREAASFNWGRGVEGPRSYDIIGYRVVP